MPFCSERNTLQMLLNCFVPPPPAMKHGLNASCGWLRSVLGPLLRFEFKLTLWLTMVTVMPSLSAADARLTASAKPIPEVWNKVHCRKAGGSSLAPFTQDHLAPSKIHPKISQEFQGWLLFFRGQMVEALQAFSVILLHHPCPHHGGNAVHSDLCPPFLEETKTKV